MRVLSYLVLLLMFSVASAQTPTILQGDYISNVFGNSNFILNPNAQTSNCTTSGTITCANVTVTNASITRVTTTPLVARTEFNVAITSANGTATWATRAFDAGMKGQNCEARFIYRGFAATSKVHIKQSTNTVASLNLTPATDPRIASINFPCGDLSTATTFVVTDTAILAGTNEISGIYTGLATNMANVAQAETVVIAKRSTSQSIPDVTYTTVVYNSEDKDVYNEFDTTTGEFTAKRAGVYQIYGSIFWSSTTWSGANLYISIFKNGVQIANWLENAFTGTKFLTQQKQFDADLAVGDKITIRAYNNSGGAKNIEGDVVYTQLTIKRFPTSSELVVTPERQNTFAAARYFGANVVEQKFIGSAAAAGTYVTVGTGSGAQNWATVRTVYGKGASPTSSSQALGVRVPNLPVGSYMITVRGGFRAYYPTANAGWYAVCGFDIFENTTLNSISVMNSIMDSTPASPLVWSGKLMTLRGVFNNSAVGDREFVLRAAKTQDATSGSAAMCDITSSIANSGTPSEITIDVVPLDQPSNSALYVQGPVQGSNTNTAIPTNSIGGKVIETNLSRATPSTGSWNIASGNYGTPPAGTYLMFVRIGATNVAGVNSVGAIVNENGGSLISIVCQANSAINGGAAVDGPSLVQMCYYTTDGTKTLYGWFRSDGATTTVNATTFLIRLN